ncbi:MAG: nitronate monooxygenase family protein [Mycetocola sp.]
MKTAICQLLDVEIPLLAFSHCRVVVAAVTNAGGFGVLGVFGFSLEQLEEELSWIDEQVGGKPYGADIVGPQSFVGKGEHLDTQALTKMVPATHKAFVANLLREHGVAAAEDEIVQMMTAMTDDIGERQLEVAFKHPIRLIANALGLPSQYMIDRAKGAGVPVAALVGAKEHAIKQVQAGVDVIVAQGTEAGGHCGEVSTLVLVPEVIEAIRPIREVPVLAAGGIVTGRQMAAAVALGAAGAWTGSVWLTAPEAETAPYTVKKLLAASSRDTVRSKGRTGKPSRQLRSSWTEAWDADSSPGALPMPLQSFISESSLRRIDALAEKGDAGAQQLATYWVGQGVGLMNRSKPAREVVREMAEDYVAATERLSGSLED